MDFYSDEEKSWQQGMSSWAIGFLRTCPIGLKYLRTCIQQYQWLKDSLPVPASRLLSWTNLSDRQPTRGSNVGLGSHASL